MCFENVLGFVLFGLQIVNGGPHSEVSASDEPLAECLTHTQNTNTQGVSKSSSDWVNYTGFQEDVS